MSLNMTNIDGELTSLTTESYLNSLSRIGGSLRPGLPATNCPVSTRHWKMNRVPVGSGGEYVGLAE